MSFSRPELESPQDSFSDDLLIVMVVDITGVTKVMRISSLALNKERGKFEHRIFY